MEPPVFLLLSGEQVKKILEEAVGVLEYPGIIIENEEARDLLVSSGAKVDAKKKIIQIPSFLIEKGLQTVPKSFQVYDMKKNVSIKMFDDNVAFRPGATALNIIDPVTNEYRPPKTIDLVKWIKMVDGVSVIEAQSGSMNCVDVPREVADSYRYYLMLKFSNKPACGGAYTIEGWNVMKELLLTVAGSKKELKQHPISIQPACPTPPLKWMNDTCQTVINNAEYGIPIIIDPMMMSGAAAPLTLEGSLVEHSAETLAALAIHQLKAPSSPFIWGGSPTIMDMREGTSLFGAIETIMLGCGHVQIGRHLNLPTGTALGITDTKIADAQAGLEAAVGTLLAMLSRANFIMGPGMIDFESGQCFEKLIIDSEIIAMLRRLLKGIQKRECPIAINLFRDPSYNGDFLSLPHTLKWMRKEFYFPSNVIDRKNYKRWEKEGKKDIVQRAREEAVRLIEQYRPKEISKETSRELDRIMLDAAKKYGMDKLPSLEG